MKWFAVMITSVICLLLLPSQVQAQTDNSTGRETSNNLDVEAQYLDNADELFKNGKYQEAISYYDKVSAIDPTSAEAPYGKGRCYEKLGQYSDAITYYDKALTNYPSYTEALTGKGVVLEDLNKTDEAIVYYNKALATDPHDTDALYDMGLALKKIGKNGQSLTYFDKILDIEPDNSDVLYLKGLVLQSLGKKDEAISYFNKVLSINPQNTAALNSRNVAMGLSPANQGPYPIDQQLLIAIGAAIAGIFAIILIGKKRSRKKILVGKTLMEAENHNKEKIGKTVQSGKKQEEDDEFAWKGI